MKKILLSAIVIATMAMSSYANTLNTRLVNAGRSHLFSIAKANPHSKEYLDIKNILNKYDQDIDKTNSCDELGKLELDFIISIMSLFDVEYEENERITEEEIKELDEQMEYLDNKVKVLKQQWKCYDEE